MGGEHAQHLLTFSLNDTQLAFIVAPLFGLLLHFFPPDFPALNGVEFQDTSTEILQTYLSQSQLATSTCLAVTHICNYIQQPHSLVCMKIHPGGCDTSGFLLVHILILRPDSV